MNPFFKTLFSPSSSKKAFGQSSLLNTKTDLASIQDGSENATRQQLIQTLHRELMRKNGIPVEWIACHTQVMVSRSKGTGMSVVLVVRHWDERLMNYAFALQRTLAADIIQFESAAEQWLHGIAWRLDVASTCPHINLPEKSYWTDQYTPAPTAAAASAYQADIAALKFDVAALRAQLTESRAQEAGSQHQLASQAQELASRVMELAETKRELASGRTERASLPGAAQRPVQRTEFMPHKAAPAVTPAASNLAAAPLVPTTAPDDSQAKLDLDRLFAIRDTALRQPAVPRPAHGSGHESPAATGYEPTQPSPLQR